MPAENPAVERARHLFQAGRHTEAETAIVAALRAVVNPDPAAYRLFAAIERELGNPELETRALEGLLTVLPAEDRASVAPVWARVATLRSRQGDVAGALSAWRSAVRAAPDVPELQFGLARARFNAQNITGAGISAAELQERFPGQAFTHVYTGHLHKATGENAEAAACYRRALEIDSCCGEALYNLAELSDDDASGSLREAAIELSNREGAAPADRINAAFAAARILDREKRFREAFECLQRANRWARSEAERSGRRYDRHAAQARVAQTSSDYSRATFGAAIGNPPVDVGPIFVIGPPRSGTTLLEQILASHSQVETAGELTAARVCEAAFRHNRAAAGREGPVDPADALDAELLENARERYIEALFERGLTGPRIVDKLPANFEIAGFLRLMFPDAPIVHSVRDLRATGYSLYNANFGAHEPWYNDLGDLAHYLRLYQRLMAHWHDVLEPPCIDVSYERLVTEPDKEIRSLLHNAGLTFEPACLEFYRHERAILTASHAQVRQPTYTSAIEHWRNYSEWLGPVAALPGLRSEC